MKTCERCGGAILTGVTGWGGPICMCWRYDLLKMQSVTDDGKVFIDKDELGRLRALIQQQAEQIAELVEYAKGLHEALESAQLTMRTKQPVYTNGTITGYSFLSDANVNTALAKPMPKAMKGEE